MRFGILVFPGTWSDTDCYYQVKDILGQDAEYVWHHETSLDGFDSVILPGGFSYGDYLRAGSMAAHSPIIREVRTHAEKGVHVLGVCNGFQILTEADMLPGVLMRNSNLKFICKDVHLKVEQNKNPFFNKYDLFQVVRVPIAHRDGNYFADETTLDELEDDGRIALRYCGSDGDVNPKHNPNGSRRNIAAIFNKRGNILGMMPHPEDAVESYLGGLGGKPLFEGLSSALGK